MGGIADTDALTCSKRSRVSLEADILMSGRNCSLNRLELSTGCNMLRVRWTRNSQGFRCVKTAKWVTSSGKKQVGITADAYAMICSKTTGIRYWKDENYSLNRLRVGTACNMLLLVSTHHSHLSCVKNTQMSNCASYAASGRNCWHRSSNWFKTSRTRY